MKKNFKARQMGLDIKLEAVSNGEVGGKFNRVEPTPASNLFDSRKENARPIQDCLYDAKKYPIFAREDNGNLKWGKQFLEVFVLGSSAEHPQSIICFQITIKNNNGTSQTLSFRTKDTQLIDYLRGALFKASVQKQVLDNPSRVFDGNVGLL